MDCIALFLRAELLLPSAILENARNDAIITMAHLDATRVAGSHKWEENKPPTPASAPFNASMLTTCVLPFRLLRAPFFSRRV